MSTLMLGNPGALFGSSMMPRPTTTLTFTPPTPAPAARPAAPTSAANLQTLLALSGQDRANAFLKGLGAMGPALIAAGAPSTDPGAAQKNIALAGQLRAKTTQDDLARQRAANVQALSTQIALQKAGREQAAFDRAEQQRQKLMTFAQTAADRAEAGGNQELADMIRIAPEAYIKNVYAKQLEAAKAGTSNRTTDIKNYNFAKQDFVDRGGKPEDFVSFPDYQKIIAMASAANPQVFVPPPSAGTMTPPPRAMPQVAPDGRPSTAPAPPQGDESQIGKIIPIPGSPAARAAEALAKKKEGRQSQKERAGLTVIQDLRRALEIVRTAPSATGIPAEITSDLPLIGKQTPAGEAKALIESALSNVGLDTLQTMRENSPTGGALGQVPVQQQKRLEQVLGSLDVGQRTEVVEDNLKRVINIYMDIVYGTPDEIQKLVDKGEISEAEATPLMKRNELSFTRFGESKDPPARPSITIRRK